MKITVEVFNKKDYRRKWCKFNCWRIKGYNFGFRLFGCLEVDIDYGRDE